MWKDIHKLEEQLIKQQKWQGESTGEHQKLHATVKMAGSLDKGFPVTGEVTSAYQRNKSCNPVFNHTTEGLRSHVLSNELRFVLENPRGDGK